MLETLRIAVMLAAFASFVGIVWWAYAPSRKVEWERKGFLEDDQFEDGEGKPRNGI